MCMCACFFLNNEDDLIKRLLSNRAVCSCTIEGGMYVIIVIDNKIGNARVESY